MDDCFVYVSKLLLLARRYAVKTISMATEEYLMDEIGEFNFDAEIGGSM